MAKMLFRTMVCLISGALGACLLTACASSGRAYTKTEMQETLETEILPNTSKMFVYRLKWPDDEIPNRVHIVRSNTGAREPYDRGGIDINRRTHAKLQENAAYVVQQMGYCREGFIELDRSISRYDLWIKGECKESATETDRDRFGDKKILPVGDLG